MNFLELDRLRPDWAIYAEHKPIKCSVEFSVYFNVGPEYEVIHTAKKDSKYDLRLDYEIEEDELEKMSPGHVIDLFQKQIDSDIALALSDVGLPGLNIRRKL